MTTQALYHPSISTARHYLSDVYSCDPQSPWQRGSNENTNRFPRRYFPKGTDLSVHSQSKLNAVCEAQPEAFGLIPRALWWSLATLTTVGYGDVYPLTVFGKLVASFMAIVGIGAVALPAGILAAAFQNNKPK